MTPALDLHRTEFPPFAANMVVDRLELFGSATTDAFAPQRSDLDFLVQFDANPSKLFDRYFGLKQSLETLYDREVDW